MQLNTRHQSRIRRAGILVVALLVGGVATRTVLQAQATSPFGEILTKLDQILGIVAPPPGPITLYSPMLNGASSGRQFRCTVLNVSAETLVVTFEIKNSFSTVEGPTVRTIPPGRSSDIVTSNTSSFSYCQVDFSGERSSVRGHYVNEVPLGGGDTEMVLTLPLN